MIIYRRCTGCGKQVRTHTLMDPHAYCQRCASPGNHHLSAWRRVLSDCRTFIGICCVLVGLWAWLHAYAWVHGVK